MSSEIKPWISCLSICNSVVLPLIIIPNTKERRKKSRLLAFGPGFLEGIVFKRIEELRRTKIKQDKIIQILKHDTQLMSFFISFSRCPLEEGEWKSMLVGVRLQSEANPPHIAKQSPRQPASIPYIFTWWSYMLMGVCLMKQSQHRGSQTGLVLGLMMSVLSPFPTAEFSS